MEIYAPQTKILEDRTKDRSRLFEALFKGVSTGFGLLLDEKWFENTLQTSRRQLVPFFSTISILNISTKVLTTNPGDTFVEMFKMEIVEKKGTSCRRLMSLDLDHRTCLHNINLCDTEFINSMPERVQRSRQGYCRTGSLEIHTILPCG